MISTLSAAIAAAPWTIIGKIALAILGILV